MIRDKSDKNYDSSTGRGMHGSKNQGGRDFDREKEVDRFEKSDLREKKEEGLHATGQGTGMGGAKSSQELKGSKASGSYSGSQQDKSKVKAKGKDLDDEEHVES